jgi:hypothetical protein
MNTNQIVRIIRIQQTVNGILRALALVALVTIVWSRAPAATLVAPPSVLATADQRTVESQALRVFATSAVEAQIARSREQFLRSPVAADPEAKPTVDKAVRELAFAATLAAVNGDPLRPRVVWAFAAPRRWLGHEVPGSRWGIDNPDNVYRFAPVDDKSRYELEVRPSGTAPVQYSFLIYDSFVGEDGREAHLDSPVASLRDQDIKASADGSFRITIDSEPANGRPNHLQTTPAARVLLIRNTFSDWQTQAPQVVAIRRVGAAPAGAALDDTAVAGRAAQLIQAATDTVLGWEAKGFAANLKPNAVAAPFTRGGGWGFASSGEYELAPDEALVVQLDHVGARYVGFDLTDRWLVSRDHIDATGSLNNHQARANADGTFTYVIAARDPGVANWLDTGGLRSGKFLIRWQALQSAKSAAEAVRSVQVVKLAALRARLPADFPQVSAAQRRAQSRFRANSYARRYLHSVADAPLASN